MAKNQVNFPIFADENEFSPAMITLALAILLVLAAVVLLAVKVLFVKGGKFPSGHVHDLAALQKQQHNRNKK
jgi:hypothetical protein